MSSYVIQKQSRGVGAIAAQDLGAVSRASGSAFQSRAQIRSTAKAPMAAQVLAPSRAPVRPRHSCPPGHEWDRIEQLCRPVLNARTRSTSSSAVQAVVGRSGKPLTPRGSLAVRKFYDPARRMRAVQSGPDTVVEEISIVDRPVVPVTAGIVSGSLPQAVALKNAIADGAAETDIAEGLIQVPQISPSKPSKLLLYGGIGAAAVLAYYLMRKR